MGKTKATGAQAPEGRALDMLAYWNHAAQETSLKMAAKGYSLLEAKPTVDHWTRYGVPVYKEYSMRFIKSGEGIVIVGKGA